MVLSIDSEPRTFYSRGQPFRGSPPIELSRRLATHFLISTRLQQLLPHYYPCYFIFYPRFSFTALADMRFFTTAACDTTTSSTLSYINLAHVVLESSHFLVLCQLQKAYYFLCSSTHTFYLFKTNGYLPVRTRPFCLVRARLICSEKGKTVEFGVERDRILRTTTSHTNENVSNWPSRSTK